MTAERDAERDDAVITRLYATAVTPAALAVLDELLLESGLLWECGCGWNNPERATACATNCGEARPAETPAVARPALEWVRPDPGLATAASRRRTGRYEITRDGRTWDLDHVEHGPAGLFLGNYLTLTEAQAEAQTYEDATTPPTEEPNP